MRLVQVGSIVVFMLHALCYSSDGEPKDIYIPINDTPGHPSITTLENLVQQAATWHTGAQTINELIDAIKNCTLPRHAAGAALYRAGILAHTVYQSDEQWTRHALHWLKLFTFIYGMTLSLSGGVLLAPACIAAVIFIIVLVDSLIKRSPRSKIRQAIAQLPSPATLESEDDFRMVAESWLAGTYTTHELVEALRLCTLDRQKISDILDELGILDHASTYASDARWVIEGLYWLMIFVFVYGMNNDIGGGIVLMPPVTTVIIFMGVLIDALIKWRTRNRIRNALLLKSDTPTQPRKLIPSSPPGASTHTQPLAIPQQPLHRSASMLNLNLEGEKRRVSHVRQRSQGSVASSSRSPLTGGAASAYGTLAIPIEKGSATGT